MRKPTTYEEYLESFPAETQKKIEQMRGIIKKLAPDAEEVISYGMPAFKWNAMLVWYGGHANHIGFYPMASGIKAFQKELSAYKSSKGAVQFPLDKPLPTALITKIVKFRMKENLEKAAGKSKKSSGGR